MREGGGGRGEGGEWEWEGREGGRREGDGGSERGEWEGGGKHTLVTVAGDEAAPTLDSDFSSALLI